MANEMAEFWSAFEKETGEKVEVRSEGTWFRVPESTRGHEGLLILTDKSFRFKYVRDRVRPWMGAGISPDLQDRSEFVIARGDVISVQVPEHARGLFAWLRRNTPPRCSVVAGGQEGEKTYVFSAEPSSGLVPALQKAWPAAAGAVVQKN